MRLVTAILLFAVAACVNPSPYQKTTTDWTRKQRLRGAYQEVMNVAAIYKSSEWRLAHAQKDAAARGLGGPARDAGLAQAQADATGAIEFELLLTTWDRRENDLDRGQKSVWRVRMLDDAGAEIEPLEIVRDKRPVLVVRSEFPSMGDFATAYVAKFPRGAEPRSIRLRLSSERGGVELSWPTK